MLALLTAFLALAAPPQSEYGLLLATSDRSAFDGGKRQRLRTYWIRGGRSATLAATLDDLVLPSNDREFVRVAIRRRCQLTEEHDECRDSLRIAGLASSHPDPRFAANAHPDDPCHFEKLVVNFAGRGLLGMERWSGNSTDCEPRGGRTGVVAFVRRIASPRELPIGEIVGATGVAAYAAAARRARDVSSDEVPEESDSVLPDSAVASDDEYDSLCRAARDATTRWGIWRRHGAWRPVLFQKLGYACELWAPVKAEIPRRFTGPDRLPVSLEKLQRESLPNDAFASPDGRVVVGDYGSSLQIRRYEGGAVGEALLRLPEGQVVMARWVTGAQMRLWDQALRGAAQAEGKGRRARRSTR